MFYHRKRENSIKYLQVDKKMSKITLKQTEKFHRKKKSIRKIVLSKTDPHEVIYGAVAINKRLPLFLRVPTSDIDILTPTPKNDALEVEHALDRRFGGNFFEISPAVHPDTVRVRSRVDGEVYADYTFSKKKPPHDRIKGKNYVKVPYIKRLIKKTLRDPESKFRHKKDRDALNRIKLSEKIRKKRARKRYIPKYLTLKDLIYSKR